MAQQPQIGTARLTSADWSTITVTEQARRHFIDLATKCLLTLSKTRPHLMHTAASTVIVISKEDVLNELTQVACPAL